MQAKYEAIKECEKQLGGNIFGPPRDLTQPKREDFPDYKAYRAAEEDYKDRQVVRFDEHRRAWRACDPYLVAAPAEIRPLRTARSAAVLPKASVFIL